MHTSTTIAAAAALLCLPLACSGEETEPNSGLGGGVGGASTGSGTVNASGAPSTAGGVGQMVQSGGASAQNAGATSGVGGASSAGGATSAPGMPSSSGGTTSSAGMPSSSGGAAPVGGITSGGGAPMGGMASGGGASGGGASGGAASGGAAGSGGVIGRGGRMGLGGDAASGGNGGNGGSAGAAAEDAVRPSPGCAKGSARPDGGIVYKAGESWLLFPEKYEGNTPLPVVVGFHGCGGGNKGDSTKTEFKGHFDGTDLGDNYVRALPLSISDGGCYNSAGDMDRAKQLFTELAENYCIDLDHVFGVGHSYGAGFLMGMTGKAEDFGHFGFRGIAPVAGWKIDSASIQVPTLYVQGVRDTERGNGDGAEVVAKVASVNGCAMETTEYPTLACNSSSGGGAVDSGCKLYSGCDVTTVWCRHDDPAYGTSYHGIPCFFRATVYDFFQSL